MLEKSLRLQGLSLPPWLKAERVPDRVCQSRNGVRVPAVIKLLVRGKQDDEANQQCHKKSHASHAVVVHSPAKPERRFALGLPERKLSSGDDRCRTRRCGLQNRAGRERFELFPSCVCRQDTSVDRKMK
jgi:hypothetical protein